MSKYTLIIFLAIVFLIYLSFVVIKRRNIPKISSDLRNRFVVGPSKRLPVFPLTSSISQSFNNDETTTTVESPQRLYMLFTNKEGKSFAHYYQVKSRLVSHLDVIDVGAMYEDEEKAFALVILYKQDKIAIVSNYKTGGSYKIVDSNISKIKQIATIGKNLYGLTSDGKVYSLSSRSFQWRPVNVEGNGMIGWISGNASHLLLDNRLYQENTDDKGKVKLVLVNNVNVTNVPHGHVRYLGKTIHDYADLNTITGQAKVYFNGILSHTYQHVNDIAFGHNVLIVKRGDENFIKVRFLFGEQMLISRQSTNDFNTTLTNTSVKIE